VTALHSSQSEERAVTVQRRIQTANRRVGDMAAGIGAKWPEPPQPTDCVEKAENSLSALFRSVTTTRIQFIFCNLISLYSWIFLKHNNSNHNFLTKYTKPDIYSSQRSAPRIAQIYGDLI
jgi:hypothetical protein